MPPLVISLCLLASGFTADRDQEQQLDAVGLYRTGQRATAAGRYDDAVQDFREAIRLDPLLTLAHYELGQTLMTLRRYPEAIQAFIGAREAFRNLASLGMRDLALADQHREDQIRELEEEVKFLRQQPGNHERAILNLDAQIANLEALKGRVPVKGFEAPPGVSLALGSAYLRSEALADAEREYREAIRINPNFGEAHNDLAVVYGLTGRFEQAEKEIALAKKASFSVSPGLQADIQNRDRRSLAAHAFAPGPPIAPATTRPPPTGATETLTLSGAPACVLATHYSQFEVDVGLRELPAAARLRFRTGETWFSMGMTITGLHLKSILPRPRPSLKRFEYVVETVDSQGTPHESEEGTVAVVSRPEDCAGRLVAAALDRPEAPIIVEGPGERRHGRTERSALVPDGFSPRGVVGDIGFLDLSTSKTLVASAVGLGAAVAGGLAVAHMGASTSKSAGLPKPDVTVSLVAAVPPSSSTISLSRDTVALTLGFLSTVSLGVGGTIDVRLDSAAGFCAWVVQGLQIPAISAGNPTTVTVVAGPPISSACPSGARIERVRVFGTAASPAGIPANFQPVVGLPLQYTFAP